MSPLYSAIENQNLEMLRLFINNKNVDINMTSIHNSIYLYDFK